MKTISPKTSLYGVIGSPVGHSLSPFIFNFLFEEMKIDAVYLAFEELDIAALIAAMRTLKIKGFSITLPHKQAAIAFMDDLAPLAKALGAINTAVYKEDRITGYNFDGLAALKALAREFPNWHEQNILILGAGGSARGIAQTLVRELEFKNNLGIAARDPRKAETLVGEINGAGGRAESLALTPLQQPVASSEKLDYGIVIQTTPLGMYRANVSANVSGEDELPMNLENLTQDTFVYDIIYTPLMTPLLTLATERGMRTLSGLDMFLEQAIMQFEIFTETSLPSEVRAAAYKKLLSVLTT